jgi:hypothetical protein
MRVCVVVGYTPYGVLTAVTVPCPSCAENVAPATQPYTDAAWQWTNDNVYQPAHPHATRAYNWLVENCITPAQTHTRAGLALAGEKWTVCVAGV